MSPEKVLIVEDDENERGGLAELVSAWGGQLITSQVRCRGCNTHFEAVRDDFNGPVARRRPESSGHPSASVRGRG